MAEIEDAFVSLLKAAAGVTGLIGSGNDARVYPATLPQDPTYPALVYENIGPGVDNDLDGVGYGNDRIRVSAFSTSYTQAKALDTQVRLALHGVKHTTVASVPVGSIAKVGGRDLFEPAVEKNDVAVHRIVGDFQVWYGLATS